MPPISLHTWPLKVFIKDNNLYVLCNMEVAHIFSMLSTWRKKREKKNLTGTLILINRVNLFLVALYHAMAEGWISSCWSIFFFNISVFFFFNPGTFIVHQKYLHFIKIKCLFYSNWKLDDQLLHVNVCTNVKNVKIPL